jgi:hypothetical protein
MGFHPKFKIGDPVMFSPYGEKRHRDYTTVNSIIKDLYTPWWADRVYYTVEVKNKIDGTVVPMDCTARELQHRTPFCCDIEELI